MHGIGRRYTFGNMDIKARIFYATCDALGEIGGHHGQTFHRSAAIFFINRYLGANAYGLVTPHTFDNATACIIALTRVRERFAKKPYMVSDLCTANPLLFALEKHYIQNGRRPLAGFVPCV